MWALIGGAAIVAGLLVNSFGLFDRIFGGSEDVISHFQGRLGEYKDGEPFLSFLANHEAEIVHFDIDFLHGGLPDGAPVQMDGLFEKKNFHQGGVRWFGLSLNCRQGPPTTVTFRFLPAGPSPSEYILPERSAWIRIRGYFEVTDVWTGMDARAVTLRPIPSEAVAVLARPLSEPEGAAPAC